MQKKVVKKMVDILATAVNICLIIFALFFGIQYNGFENAVEQASEMLSPQNIPPIRYSGGIIEKSYYTKSMVVSALEKIPPSLREGITQVTISRVDNPGNENLRKEYQDPNFRSIADVEPITGKVRIFPETKENSTVEVLVGYISHEAGHRLDLKLGNGEWFSDQAEWEEAIQADYRYGCQKYGDEGYVISLYAYNYKRVKGSNREIFADCVRELVTRPAYFREYFPNEERILRREIPDAPESPEPPAAI